MDCIEFVTASHGHTDHLDPETLLPHVESNKNLDLIVPTAELELDMERSSLSKDKIKVLGNVRLFRFNFFGEPIGPLTMDFFYLNNLLKLEKIIKTIKNLK